MSYYFSVDQDKNYRIYAMFTPWGLSIKMFFLFVCLF